MLHGHIPYPPLRGSAVIIVVDDIPHAHGSVVHLSLEGMLTAACFGVPLPFGGHNDRHGTNSHARE